ncbi:30S ribosomal protein S1 [Thiorhodovibrio frisius]|uniref:Ribosomal protein S1 n=1 Tax=Thiorhodovibrio frisius TaxID=631362 RepID=H8Z0L6_9GAMM|nr:S1 RNA-binding domain-containing protein [Thiorhodovibrio frisius]EIC22357.1 ribosomal protein S1 [Thiorhodovibrio frisius]WPL24656.1 30S ribosomal protein S1 [Thiorhodovibrio frisius]
MTEETSFAAMLAESEPKAKRAQHEPKVGDQVRGEIVAIDADQVFVAIGGKTEALMDIINLTAEDGSLKAQIGDTIDARITSIDADTGAPRLGQRHGRALHGSEELEAAFHSGQPVEGQITGVIKGGVEVQIAGHRAFCPASQVELRFIEDLSTLVGERHEFRITKFSGGRKLDLVVSRRALLEEAQAAAAEETRAKLEVGAVLYGTVTQLKDFGAFVDLGGVEGMVHISELAFGHVRHPEDMLRTGQQIEVQVLRIEQTNNPKRPEKIALSIRALAQDPWSDAHSRFPVGTQISGKVTRLQPFGAFVELAPGLEGLIHISEFGGGRRIAHPQEVVNSDQLVEVRVLGVDTERRRISLALANEGAEPADTASPDPVSSAAAKSAREKASGAGQEPAMGTLGELLREQMRQK